jgi:hypothetical protein
VLCKAAVRTQPSLLSESECIAFKKVNSEQVAHYFAEVAKLYEQEDHKQSDIFLDRNSTHKTKMRHLFQAFSAALKIKNAFPFYSRLFTQVESVGICHSFGRAKSFTSREL